MAKKKYTVQTPVRHDGKDYAPSESIELDIADDHYLITDGVVSDGKPVKSRSAKVEAEAMPQETAEQPVEENASQGNGEAESA